MAGNDVFNITNVSKCPRYPVGRIDDYTHQIDILKYFANLVHFDDLPKENGLSIAISVINKKKTMSLSGIRQIKVRFNRLLYKLDHSYHDEKMKDWICHPKINRRKYNRTAKNKNDLYDKDGPYKYNRRIRERKYTSEKNSVEPVYIAPTDKVVELVDVPHSEQVIDSDELAKTSSTVNLDMYSNELDSSLVDILEHKPEPVIHYTGNIIYDPDNTCISSPFNLYVDKKATFIISPELFNFESYGSKKDTCQTSELEPIFQEIIDPTEVDSYYAAAW